MTTQQRPARRRRTKAPPITAADAARAVALRYVNDSRPGIERRGAPGGFSYVGPDGATVRDEATLARIRALAIPPAWTDVWISPIANGHLQATGRDAKGRKQYRYHQRWHAVRDETKYGRMIDFGRALPRIRARVTDDLARPTLSREKLLATLVRLLETTGMRVGNEEYARTNGSFGLTTLQNGHVRIEGSTLRFRFRGKSGQQHAIRITDRRLAAVVRRIRDLPGQELFQYVNGDGEPRPIDSADVNDYIREVAGEEFTAKDFRTWSGTLLAARALAEWEFEETATAAKGAALRAIESVAEALGNTPAVCRKSYIHPAVLDAWTRRELHDLWKATCKACVPDEGLTEEEGALVAYLEAVKKAALADA